jgi:membrane protein DedA with SNARE-associated domain
MKNILFGFVVLPSLFIWFSVAFLCSYSVVSVIYYPGNFDDSDLISMPLSLLVLLITFLAITYLTTKKMIVK